MRWPPAIPIRGTASAALVVEDRQTSVLERIETIDAHGHLGTRQGQTLLELGTFDAEPVSGSFQQAEFLDEATRAATLAGEDRRAVAPSRPPQDLVSGPSDTALDQRFESGFGVRG